MNLTNRNWKMFLKLIGFEEPDLKSKIINPNKTALIVIDIQDKLINSMPLADDLILKIEKMISSCKILRIPIYMTEQNPAKLGETISNINSIYQGIKYSKMSFSICECKELINNLKKQGIENVLLCGVETHVCIYQSSKELIKKGFNVSVIVDCVQSRHELDHKIALDRLKGLGVEISSYEMTVFELVRTAKHKEFKSISNLIKK